MADFWDEESAREIHEYNLAKKAEEKGIEKGIEKGKTEERNNGINKMIQLLKGMQASKEEIHKQLKAIYDLTDQEIEKFI